MSKAKELLDFYEKSGFHKRWDWATDDELWQAQQSSMGN